MDEKRQEDDIFPKSSSQHCLFPISSSVSESVQCASRQAALFPSVGVTKSEKIQGKGCKQNLFMFLTLICCFFYVSFGCFYAQRQI